MYTSQSMLDPKTRGSTAAEHSTVCPTYVWTQTMFPAQGKRRLRSWIPAGSSTIPEWLGGPPCWKGRVRTPAGKHPELAATITKFSVHFLYRTLPSQNSKWKNVEKYERGRNVIVLAGANLLLKSVPAPVCLPDCFYFTQPKPSYDSSVLVCPSWVSFSWFCSFDFCLVN